MKTPMHTLLLGRRSLNSKAQRKLLIAFSLALSLVVVLASAIFYVDFRSQKRPESMVAIKAPSQERPGTSAKPQAPAAEPAPVQLRVGPGYLAGDLITFRMNEKRSLVLTGAPLAGEAPGTEPRMASIALETSGKVQIKVYEKNDRGWVLGFEALEPKVKVAASGTEMESKELAETMVGEVLVSMAPNGLIGTVLFPTTMSAEACNQWRDRLSRFEIVFPETDGLNEWTAAQIDTTGKYTAAYTRKMVDGKWTIRRAKVEYAAVGADSSADLASSTFADGEAVIVIEPPLLQMNGHESIRFAPEGARQEGEAEIHFVFERESMEKSAAVLAAARSRVHMLETLRGTTLGASDMAKSLALNEEYKDLGTPSEEIAVLRATVEAQGANGDDTHERMLRVIALIKKSPAAVEGLLDALREDISPELAGVLIGALGAAGTDAAQRGLQDIFAGQDWKQPLREEALYALAQIKDPIPELDDSLLKLYEEKGPLASTALLLLAAMGERATQTDSLRRARIEEFVHAEASRMDLDTDLRVAALGAVENLASDQTPAVVSRAAVDADDLVRSAAMEALSKTPDPAADEILLRALRNDPSEEVRVHAAKVIGETDRPGGDDLLQQVVLHDNSDRVRIQAIQSLTPRAQSDAAVRSLLTAVAERDESSEVQDAAKVALNGGNSLDSNVEGG